MTSPTILWDQKELEILLDLWAPYQIHKVNPIYFNKGAGMQGCKSDNTVISSVIGNIQFCRISAEVNY